MQKERSADTLIIINIVISGIGLLINYFINFFMTPYITNNIGVEAYGFISLANNVINYIDIISVALNTIASRYISIEYHKGNYVAANKYYNSVIVADCILSIAIFIPCLIIVSRLERFLSIPETLVNDVKVLFILVIANYLISIIGTVFNVATFIKNRLDLTSINKSVSIIIKAIVLITIFSIFYPHVWFVAVATILASIYILFRNIYYTKILTPQLFLSRKLFSKKAILELLRNGIWNSITNLGNVLNSGLDLLASNLMIGATAMGQLSISKSLTSIFNTFISMVGQAFRPVQLKAYSEKNYKKLINELNISMKVCGFICSIIFSIFFALCLPFLSLWIPGQNINLIANITLLVIFGDVFGAIVYPLWFVFTLTNKLKFPSTLNITVGIINLLSMIILLKYTSWGLYAVVITTTILNFIVQLFVVPISVAIYLKVAVNSFYQVILRNLFNCFVLSIVFKVIVNAGMNVNSWVGVILSGVILGIIGIIISGIVLFNSKERTVILNKLKRN